MSVQPEPTVQRECVRAPFQCRLTKESGMGRIIAAARAQSGMATSLKPVFTSHMAIVLKMFATEGRGLTWSPMSLVANDLSADGPLARAGGEEWDIPIDIWLLRPRARLDSHAEAFWLFLKEREQMFAIGASTSSLFIPGRNMPDL